MTKETRSPDIFDILSRQPARVPGQYKGFPFSPDGLTFHTDQTLTIKQRAGVAWNEPLLRDIPAETVGAIKQTMIGEHNRARRLSGLNDKDHVNLRGLVAELYGPSWEFSEKAKERYALEHGIDIAEVTENMLPGEDRARLSLLREEARKNLRENPIAQEVNGKKEKYASVIERTRKVGIVINSINEDGKVAVDVFPVPYALYAHLATPEFTEKAGRIGELLATAASVITTDNIVVIQIREGNNIYDDMLGTSTGGLKDGRKNERVVGSVRPVTNETVIENVQDEMNWEVGQDDPSKIKTLQVINVVKEDDDKIPHTEAIIYTEVDMTFEEFARNAWIKKGRPSPSPGHEFPENFIGISADPDTLLQFFAVPRPLPATHYSTLVGAGFMQEYKRTGSIEAAEQWQRRAESVITRSIRQMNKTVREYWQTHPDERAAYTGDTSQYDPHFPAGMQGLGNAIKALEENGIHVYHWKP
jgi:hypothetical protein